MTQIADFDNPIVQVVYELICAQDEAAQPPEGEHWEGYLARRIVPAVLECLRTPTPEMVERAMTVQHMRSDRRHTNADWHWMEQSIKAALDPDYDPFPNAPGLFGALSPSKGEGE